MTNKLETITEKEARDVESHTLNTASNSSITAAQEINGMDFSTDKPISVNLADDVTNTSNTNDYAKVEAHNAAGNYSSTDSYEAHPTESNYAPIRKRSKMGFFAKLVATLTFLAAGCMPTQYARISYGSHRSSDSTMPDAGLVDASYGMRAQNGWGFETGIGSRDDVHRQGNQGGIDWTSDHSATRYRVVGTYSLPRKGGLQVTFDAGVATLAETQTDTVGPPINANETQTNTSTGPTAAARLSIGSPVVSGDLEVRHTSYQENSATTFSVSATYSF